MGTTKGRHLTLQDRIDIQDCLAKRMTFKAIGKLLSKDQTTISKEVKKHIKVHTNSFVKKNDECCPKLLKAPFVCNGCEYRCRSSCPYPRHLYDAKQAEQEYKALLTDAREGVALNKDSFYSTEEIISAGVKKGQHLYHILKTHNISIGSSTVYRYISKGYYTVGKLDFPRIVKFKPRAEKHNEYAPKCVKKDRNYEDFLNFIEEHDINNYVELDTVIGRVGGKTIMTLHFTAFNFMFGILLENKTSIEVATKIKQLKEKLLIHGFSFSEIFPVILTDNGGEFSCVDVIENNTDGENSKLFFCEPHTPSEKGKIEKNHTMFRDIVPKGTSFDEFTQDTVNLIFSHVNSVKRKNFNGKSSYEMFCFTYSRELAEILGVSEIAAVDVIQSPKLLRN